MLLSGWRRHGRWRVLLDWRRHSHWRVLLGGWRWHGMRRLSCASNHREIALLIAHGLQSHKRQRLQWLFHLLSLLRYLYLQPPVCQMPHHAAPGHKGPSLVDPRREDLAARRAVGEAQRARPWLPPTAE